MSAAARVSMAAQVSMAPAGAADAGAFLARLVRFDADALVRLRSAAEDRVTLWARLPWGTLVTRTTDGSLSVADATVSAGALLRGLRAGPVALPARLDVRWRWGLPPDSGARVVESLPAARVRELGSAAERTLRAAAGVGEGRTVGERAVREALLDHVAIVVRLTVDESTVEQIEVEQIEVEQIEVPQRLVQAVVRMGFLRPLGDAAEPPVHVLVAGRFVGLAAEYGVAWHRPGPNLDLRAIG